MLNPFALEKGILKKLAAFEAIVEGIKKEVCEILVKKSRELDLELTQDLKEKCAIYLKGSQNSKLYMCKICLKKFNDGRKLGGHVSRAHKYEVMDDHL